MTSMTSAQKAGIIDALIQCAAIRDHDARRTIFARLPFFAEIPDDPVPFYHVQKAVDLSERLPVGLEILMDAVLWGEGLTDPFLGVCDVLQQLRSWGVEWKLVFELKLILRNVDLNDARVASAYRKAQRFGTIPEAHGEGELLSVCLYDLANCMNSQLSVFVVDLLPDIVEKHDAVKAWLEKASIPAQSARSHDRQCRTRSGNQGRKRRQHGRFSRHRMVLPSPASVSARS